MKLAASVEGSYTRQRDIEPEGSSDSGSKINTFRVTENNQGYAKLILGISDYANIYAKFGASKINAIDLTFSTGEDVTIESDTGVLYGGGVNLFHTVSRDDLYFLDKFVDIEADFNYFLGLGGDIAFCQSDADEMYIAGTNATNVSGKIKNLESQLSIFTGLEFMIDENFSIAPYVAGFWNGYHIETDAVRYNTNVLNFDNDAEDAFGAGAGLELNLSPNITLNVEGRFVGSQSISFGGTAKF